MESKLNIGIIAIIILSINYTNSANIPLRPVFEHSVENGEYLENPLEGLSPDILKQRARSHVQNQQMRFNSEKTRMQRAQARRFQEVGGETMDSYIKAHREQQETYQREVEKKFILDVTALAKAQNVTRTTAVKKEKQDNTPKINRTVVDANQKNVTAVRNKRMEEYMASRKRFVQKPSRGVVYASYPPYFNPAHHKNVKNFAPVEYGQNYGKYSVENSGFKLVPSPQLHAEDVSSLTSSAFKHPLSQQQFSQINVYNQNEDVESSLAALIGKDPNDQIEGLNQLLQQSTANHKITNEDLRNININLKSSSLDVPSEYYANYEPPNVYVTPEYTYPKEYQQYQQVRDHTPITENVQDVADTRRPIKIVTEHVPYITERPIAHTSSTNYYKVEVASEVKEIPYSSDPAYTSYSSGYDDVSIDVEDKLKDTNSSNKNLQNRFKPKIKTNTKKQPNTFDDSDSSEIIDPNVYTLTTTNKPNVFRGNLKFGDRIVQRPKPKDSVIQHIKRNKRQVMYRNHNLSTVSRSVGINSRTKSSGTIENKFNSNTTQKQFVKTKLKTSLVNSYVKAESDSLKIPINKIGDLSRQVNCSECFKSNGESEFYYYDNGNNTDSQIDDDFPSYDDLTYNSTGLSVNFNASDMSVIQINGTNITAENPHFEALRYRIIRMPKLYRLLNGRKTRVLYPNAKRFQRYLVQRPIKEYLPSRYAGGFGAGSDYGIRGVNSQFNSFYEPEDEYVIDDPTDDQDDYYDDSESPEYEEVEETYNRNRYENIIDRPPYSQYASGYNNYNEDYIQIDAPSYQNRNNRFNTYRNPQGYGSRGREKYRYASDYNQNQNYISDDIYNDYTRNFRGRHRVPQLGHSFDYDYTQSGLGPQFISDPEGDEYIDSVENYGNNVQFEQNHNKDFSDSYGNYYGSSFNKKKPQEPSNYYVENYNQFLSKPGQSGHGSIHEEYESRPKPVNVFNIIRTEGAKKRQKFAGHDDNGGVIHIDSLNVYPHGQNAWKPPQKHPHGLYGIPRRPIKHRRKRPAKWRGPRIRSRKHSYNRKNHMRQVQHNIHKIENIFRRI